MTEISKISASRITSKPRVTFEGVQPKKEIEPASEIKEFKQLENALFEAQKIRTEIERALHNLGD